MFMVLSRSDNLKIHDGFGNVKSFRFPPVAFIFHEFGTHPPEFRPGHRSATVTLGYEDELTPILLDVPTSRHNPLSDYFHRWYFHFFTFGLRNQHSQMTYTISPNIIIIDVMNPGPKCGLSIPWSNMIIPPII